MHNYKCSCHIENKSYERTIKAHDSLDAYFEFSKWLYYEHDKHLELADGIVIDKVESDADL